MDLASRIRFQHDDGKHGAVANKNTRTATGRQNPPDTLRQIIQIVELAFLTQCSHLRIASQIARNCCPTIRVRFKHEFQEFRRWFLPLQYAP